MLSKNKIKWIKGLELKKKRQEERVFVAEGSKLVSELLGVFPCVCLVSVPEWELPAHITAIKEQCTATWEEIGKASFLKTPSPVLAVFQMPATNIDEKRPMTELCLALDGVQDPGNLGTIIRVADWFGIRHLYASLDTADIYNPKTVQATMGAIGRVSVHYCSLPELLQKSKGEYPIYGTFLDGTDMYEETLSSHGLIIMGNEGKGISAEVAQFVTHRLFIPNYPADSPTSESLNVALATGIICAEFRRRMR